MIAVEKAKEILKGIDECECDHVFGWWETSDGAEFGKKKLQEIIDLIKDLEGAQ